MQSGAAGSLARRGLGNGVAALQAPAVFAISNPLQGRADTDDLPDAGADVALGPWLGPAGHPSATACQHETGLARQQRGRWMYHHPAPASLRVSLRAPPPDLATERIVIGVVGSRPA